GTIGKAAITVANTDGQRSRSAINPTTNVLQSTAISEAVIRSRPLRVSRARTSRPVSPPSAHKAISGRAPLLRHARAQDASAPATETNKMSHAPGSENGELIRAGTMET